MRKTVFFIFFLIFTTVQIFSQVFFSELEPDSNESVIYAGSYDWGLCVEKLVINAGHSVSPKLIRAKDFEVKKIIYSSYTNIGISKGTLSVTDAFTSDSFGNRISEPSQFITILTDVHPEAENSNPLVSLTIKDKFKGIYGYKIENDELDIKIKKVKGFVNKNISKFNFGSFSHIMPASEEEKSNPKYTEEQVTFNYGEYIPKTTSDEKLPLIIWLHGIAESGTNIYEVLSGTKMSELADEKIQSYFDNGCAVLAPQCPTAWLKAKEKGAFGINYWTPVEKDMASNKIKKPIENFLNKLITTDKKPETEIKIPFAAVSYYTESLMALIEEFLNSHSQIDKNRIYICGCSAGGYMTINMLLQYQDFFAAGIPICEYYLDSKITDEQISNLSKIPLWFVYSKKDDTVNPKNNSIPTIERLKKQSAENLHVSEFDSIIDNTGTYLLDRDADSDDKNFGLPYEYSPHSSWIYFFTNECEENGLNIFHWLSKQKNSKNLPETDF